MGEEFFFGAEGGGVDAAAGALVIDGMAEVEHLVIEDVFQSEAFDAVGIEDAADDDDVVRHVVMAEDAAGTGGAPTQGGARHETMEEPLVQLVEDYFEMVMLADGAAELFTAAGLAESIELSADVGPIEVPAVPVIPMLADGPAEELR